MSKTLTGDEQDNFELFVEQVRDSGTAWVLDSDKGWAVCESEEFDDALVYPIWSERDYAQLHCEGDWSHYKPLQVPVDLLIEEAFPGMVKDEALVGPNWDAELSGLEIEPDNLAWQLTDETE